MRWRSCAPRAGKSESDLLHASLYAFATPAVAVTYANAYSRASVVDNLCGFSFATTTTRGTGVPAAAATSPMLTVFAQWQRRSADQRHKPDL